MKNDLPPQSQPWLRTIKDTNTRVSKSLKTIEQDANLQLNANAISLEAVQRRIAALDSAANSLPAVVSGEAFVYFSNSGLAANTWGTIATAQIAKPANKSNVSVIAFSTVFLQTSGGDYIHQFRSGVDGVYFPSTVVSEGSSGGYGMAVFSTARTITNITGDVFVTVQYNSPAPSTIVSGNATLATISYTAVFS